MALFVTHPTITLTAEIEADSQAEADHQGQVMVETAFTLGASIAFGSKFEVGVTDADGNFVRDEHVHVPFEKLPVLDLDSLWADEEGAE